MSLQLFFTLIFQKLLIARIVLLEASIKNNFVFLFSEVHIQTSIHFSKYSRGKNVSFAQEIIYKDRGNLSVIKGRFAHVFNTSKDAETYACTTAYL